ncbi:4529_t:CDS:2 [Dentiscutata erythropus]|uniref:4529_t:CDS:1 n=1 Tax=Dentiscutata erythropus TaxID=1348616 RepID=A0A9N9A5X8_9GLOM|nr:4529_t:CDS:2 [Dentiscutata erythropus]
MKTAPKNSEPNLEAPLRSLAISNQSEEHLQSEKYAESYRSSSPVELFYEDQQIQNCSSYAANKYQYQVPLQTNKRPNISSIQSKESVFPQCSNSYSEHLSDHEDETSENEFSEDKIFSSLNQHNSNLLNIHNANYVNPYLAIQPNKVYMTIPATNNELSFQDEAHLLRWLSTQKDLVLVALNTICSSLSIISNQAIKTQSNWKEISNKLRQAFENFCTTYNNDIAKLANQLIRKRRPLKKHIDALDFDAFKSRQPEVKSLENFIAASIKIHVEFLIAESKEDPDYNSIVLNRIKELNNTTTNFKFPAASHLQHANQLELKEEWGRLKN